ncbi:MAG: hypothetical protein KIS94_10155 [Chitinophagales bacterium]|nr:hypothetical protein [Chitinophagales bacterium]
MKFRNLFLAAVLFCGCHTVTFAQDKYDLAVIGYYRDVPDPLILISVNGEKFEQIIVSRDELNGKTWGMSVNPLLKQVNKFQDQGWEVVGGMQTSGLPNQSMFYYSLRKKR